MVSLEESKARTIVIIEWVIFGILALGMIILGILFAKPIADILNEHHENDGITRATGVLLKVFLILFFIYVILTVFFNLLLTKGVHQANVCCCKTWYILGIIGLVFTVLELLFTIATFNIIAFVIKGALFVYKIYAVHTIMTFTRCIEVGTNSAGAGVVFSTVTINAAPAHAQQQQQFQPQPQQFQQQPQQFQQQPQQFQQQPQQFQQPQPQQFQQSQQFQQPPSYFGGAGDAKMAEKNNVHLQFA